MADKVPRSALVTSARDEWLFLRDSPIGLREDKIQGSLFPSTPAWPASMIDDLIDLGERYTGRPLVALAASDAGVRTHGFSIAPQGDRDRYYAARMKIWSHVLAEHPSSLWFGWYFDISDLAVRRGEAPYCVRVGREERPAPDLLSPSPR